MTNPVEIIKRDHRKVEELFKEYEDLNEQAYATKEKKMIEITKMLKMHSEMEEKLFYSRAKELLNHEDEKMIEEAIAEHDVAKRLLEELSVTHPEDPQFDARVKVLNENITHHVMEEEKELLPKAQEIIQQEILAAIGEEMRAFRIENGIQD